MDESNTEESRWQMSQQETNRPRHQRDQQLAAEQENVRQRGERMQQLVSENVVLRKQLADEKDKRCQVELEADQLREQLDAERKLTFEAQQAALREGIRSGTLVDALKKSREIHESMRPDLPLETLMRLSMKYQAVIDVALAKVEDQPVQLPMINDDPVVTLK